MITFKVAGIEFQFDRIRCGFFVNFSRTEFETCFWIWFEVLPYEWRQKIFPYACVCDLIDIYVAWTDRSVCSAIHRTTIFLDEFVVFFFFAWTLLLLNEFESDSWSWTVMESLLSFISLWYSVIRTFIVTLLCDLVAVWIIPALCWDWIQARTMRHLDWSSVRV